MMGLDNTRRRERDRMVGAALTLCTALTFVMSAAEAQQPPTFTTGLPPPGFWHMPYTFTLKALGTPSPLFSVLPSVSVLPPGLTLNGATGVLSGTPTYAGFFNGLFTAYNGAGPTAIQPFTILITPNQGINFPALPNQPLGSPPLSVTATASSGLPVTFSMVTPSVCTVSGNIVTLVAMGTCTIRASQAGNAVYSNAIDVNQSFTVTASGTPVSQTISFGPLGNKPFNSPPFELSATASSGLPVSFSSLTTAICTVSGNIVTPVAVGTCTIRASQAGNTTYNPAPNVDQSFAITSGLLSQTITFGALSNKALGTPPFTVSATASSGLPVSFSSLTPAVCAAAGNTVLVVAVGTCTIRASQAGNTTYAPAPNVDQSFAVTVLISQTITFAALGGKTYGDPPFTVSATASSGLPLSFSSLTTSICVVSGNTVTLFAVGTCTIRASQAGNAVYAPAPNVDQTFSVARASQTITFAALSNKPLGTAPFTVSATASSGLPVSFSSLTTSVCTINGNIATLIAAGTCTVRASQAGNSTYAAAANVDQSFNVQTAQTITFAPLADRPVTDGPFTPSAFASSGLQVTFSSLTNSVCTVSGNVVTLIAIGTCTIRASQTGNAAYAPAADVDRSFSVAPVTQYIYDGAGNLIGIHRN